MSTFEEQFAALFGKSPDGKKLTDRKFMKYTNQGESFAFVITGNMETTPQQIQVDKKYYEKVLVRPAEGQPFKPMAKHQVPEGHDERLIWTPPGDNQFPVRVLQHKDAGGKLIEGFEPFDTTWELRAGNRMEKLEEAMMEERMLLGKGVRVIEKLLDKNSKPYKYAIKIAPPKEA